MNTRIAKAVQIKCVPLARWFFGIGTFCAVAPCRAGFTESSALDFPSVDQDGMRTIIRNERRSEFALEGIRVFDIRRWKLSETVLNGYPHGAQFGDPTVDNGFLRLTKRTFNPQRDYLWAIPQSQMDLDPNLTQNPGY